MTRTAEFLTSIIANGTTVFLIIVAMANGLIVPRMLFGQFLPVIPPHRRHAVRDIGSTLYHEKEAAYRLALWADHFHGGQDRNWV